MNHDPPYIAVIFSSLLVGDDPAYSEAAQRMIGVASTMPGFIGIETARDPSLGISVSYWTDEQAVRAWREHPEHLEIQARGRQEWYAHYELRVAHVTRARSFTREVESPPSST